MWMYACMWPTCAPTEADTVAVFSYAEAICLDFSAALLFFFPNCTFNCFLSALYFLQLLLTRVVFSFRAARVRRFSDLQNRDRTRKSLLLFWCWMNDEGFYSQKLSWIQHTESGSLSSTFRININMFTNCCTCWNYPLRKLKKEKKKIWNLLVTTDIETSVNPLHIRTHAHSHTHIHSVLSFPSLILGSMRKWKS